MTNIVTHSYQGFSISQKQSSSYVSLTDMAKATGKRVNDYLSLDSTLDYLSALSQDTGIAVSSLIQMTKGKGKVQGTWAHPEIAVDFASWCNVQFRIWANRTLLRTSCSTELDDYEASKQELKAAQAEYMAVKAQFLRSKTAKIKARLMPKPVAPIVFNPSIKAWVDDTLKPDPESMLYIGIGNKQGTLSYAYRKYCELNDLDALSFHRFSNELLKYAKHGKQWNVAKCNHNRIGTPLIGLSFA